MENQQPAPSRPLFRLLSQIRTTEPPPPPPPQPPAIQTRPTLVRTASLQAIRLPPPATQPQPEPQPQPREPAPPTVALAPPTQRVAVATSSPKATASPRSSSLSPSPKPKTSTSATSSLPTSPVIDTSSASRQPPPPPAITKTSSSSLPTSPKPEAVTQMHPSPSNKSPKIIKPSEQTPPQSPKPKPSAPPPSPLLLPSPQLKPEPEPEPKPVVVAEQKNVLVQERRTMPGINNAGEGKPTSAQNGKEGGGNGVKDVNSKDKEKDARKKTERKTERSSEEVGMKVITLTGENKGAVMELGYSNRKEQDLYIRNPHRLGSTSHGDQSQSERSSSDEEGKMKRKDKAVPKSSAQSLPISAFINSNVQGVNNSILFNSSFASHDPGVHLYFSRKPVQNQVIQQAKDHSHGRHA
ncbi:PREDICTED: proline-rich receptor-like protein kinase PERK9 [Nelumbo nucifera]|uniref:Proline-rich receptor-like protein kinase PERK9 n=1 Tax=Nelumbo nucifera TaxID=4432 RepID=A0A1U7ZRH2_NELNU|nr:PREDICTED: proline-rich receptor-like protein kinase PERK9 [Nelumbo nucifera]